MAHWTEPYVGLRYVPGEFDCGALAERVQREVFHREIQLPTDRPYVDAQTAIDKFEARAAQIQRECGSFAVPTDKPVEGDGVLIWARGYLQHIGICSFVGGELWILHAASSKMHVVFQRASTLVARGLKLEGFYKWI